ncbi:MAG: IS110 family transposase [Polyangiaceae bacterium]
MKNMPPTAMSKDTAKAATLYMAIEMSSKTWKIAFGDGSLKARQVDVAALDYARLCEEVCAAKRRFKLAAAARVVSLYEAGRDAFEPHRALTAMGIENLVVDSSSIQVDRRAKRAKTDRLDAERLLVQLIRYDQGEKSLLRVVKVPTRDQEDARRVPREIERLKKERTALHNRVTGLLAGVGVRRKVKVGLITLLENLDDVRLFDREPLPANLRAELERDSLRLAIVTGQIRDLEKASRLCAAKPQDDRARKIAKLQSLKGVGNRGALILVSEFGWREFRNRKQVAACAGLCGTPYDSGESRWDQGISKAGNRRVRTLMIEIAWFWLRYQPASALARWWTRRFAPGGKRLRRVGIVALARKLLIALWRFMEAGVVPEGAELAA